MAHRHIASTTGALCLLCTLSTAVLAGPRISPPMVSQRLDELKQQLAGGEDPAAVKQKADAIFDAVAAYGRTSDDRSFVEAYFVQQLAEHMGQLPAEQRASLAPYLVENEDLAKAVTFLISDRDQPREVYELLAQLKQAHGEKVATYANLAAAMCVVHDQRLRRHINENKVQAPEAVALFKFFVDNERKMLFGLKDVPAELLVWVVDSTAAIDEMQWAVEKYAGDRAVGKRFFDIAYDFEHLRTGRTKAVTAKGFTLPNIREYGGVCADQAYFAVAVGKAIGVPTAYVVGKSGSSGHAWVGFLQARGRTGMWNFDVGRYRAYQGVKGVVIDPQTRQRIPDSYVSLMGELIGTRQADRYAAKALTAAARRLGEAAESDQPFTPDPIGADDEAAAPTDGADTSVQRRLMLVHQALRNNAGEPRAWFVVRDLAEAGKLDLDQIQTWAGHAQQMTGTKYPDFAMAMLKPMIASIENPREQSKLWDGVFGLFRRRSDLAAEARMAQGALWEQQGDARRAGQCYEDVINRFANAGPFVIDALAKTEQMLVETGKADRVPRLYGMTWKRLKPPGDEAAVFASQANWYKVGRIYADRLEAAGDADEAADVRAELNKRVGDG